MSVAPSPLDELQAQLEHAASNGALTPAEREAKLRYLRAQIDSLLGRADKYLADVRLQEQADDIERANALLAIREAADMRAEALRRGLTTVEEMDAAGVPSHEQLDQLAEEGLLMEFSLHSWKADLHPRDRSGRWRDVFKSVEPKGRTGRKQPAALHAPKDKGPRLDVTPKELGHVPAIPKPPSPEHAHKEGALTDLEKAAAERDRLAHMTEEERVVHYRSQASAFDRKVSELASARLAGALSKLGPKRDPGTVVVHPEDVDSFLKGAPYGKVLYHGTPRTNIESILSSGLRGGDTHMDVRGRETVFLTSSPDVAKGHGTPVAVATKLDRPLIIRPGENASDAMKRDGVSNLDGYDGMVRQHANGTEVVTSWEPRDDLKVVTDEPVIDPRTLDKAELKFNAAGSVNQHTLGEYAREAAGEPDTVDLHSTTAADGSRTYSPERQALHEIIIGRFLREKKQVGDKWVHADEGKDLQGSDSPHVLFSGGGYSAGKGGVVKSVISGIDSGYDGPPLVLDPDEIKGMLPEFQQRFESDPLANALVYREAWDIAQEIQRRAQERKLNMVVDGISNTSPEEMIRRVKSFTDQGYSAKAIYVDIPTEEAIKRATKRAQESTDKKDRRMIPTLILRAVHRDVAATIPALARRVEKEGIPLDIEVHDNNQPAQEGEKFGKPKLFFSYDSKQKVAQVHDESLWAALRAKGHEKLPEEQPLTEGVWEEAKHPRGRGGKWVNVLRGLDFPEHVEGADHDARREQLADYLYRRAEASEPKVTGLLRNVMGETGGHLEGFEFRLKTRDSTIKKLRRWQAEDERKGKKATPDMIAKRIGDTLRYTAVFDESQYAQGVRAVVDGMSSLGFRKVELENYWLPGEDYSGVNAQFVGPDGQPVELQFHTPTSYTVKSMNWPVYEQYREAADEEHKIMLWEQMVANNAQIEIPPGVDLIGPLTPRDPLIKRHTSVE